MGRDMDGTKIHAVYEYRFDRFYLCILPKMRVNIVFEGDDNDIGVKIQCVQLTIN